MIKKSLIIILNELFLWIFNTPVHHPRFWEDERDKRRFVHSYGFFKKLKTMLAGFNSDKYVLYQLDKNDKKLYVNDIRRRILSERISKKHYYIVHNKIVFEKYFQGVVPTIPKLALIQNGRFLKLTNNQTISSIDELLEQARNGQEFFLKPYDGGSGRGILRTSYSKPEKHFLVNKEIRSETEVVTLIASLNGYLVEKRFEQKGLSNDIYPDTLNTIRVLTLIDPERRTPFIAAAVHRFGTKKSTYADNWSQGGLSVWIDPETGIMGKGVQYPFDGKLKFLSRHPDTSVGVEGVQIYQWERIKDSVLKAAEYVSFMPMIGWDVVVSGKDVFLLEANYNPDINLIQVHRPLLTNYEVRDFYAYHNVL